MSQESDPKPIIESSPAPPQKLLPADYSVGTLIHPLSALVLIVVDFLWMVPEFVLVSWWLTIPLSFMCVFVATFLVQRFLNRDAVIKSAVTAFILGVLAAVPTMIMGTAVGLLVLTLAGLGHLSGRNKP